MLPYRMQEIDGAVFQEVCDQSTSESGTLDFKQALPGKTDENKEEFAKDVSAFLNADGGDLVYGISEDRSTGSAKDVIPLQIDNFDRESRRLLSILDAWIEPRFHGIDIHEVKLDGGSGIVVRVPASLEGPHSVRVPGEKRRFVVRNGKMASDMSYEQIRSAFGRTATLAESARGFAQGRIARVQSKSLQVPMVHEPLAVFEAVPLSGISGRLTVDMKKVQFTDLIIWTGSTQSVMNLDGVGAYMTGGEFAYAQSQAFRNGALEYIDIVGRHSDEGGEISGERAIDVFKSALASARRYATKHQLSGPAVVVCALCDVGKCKLYTPGYSPFRRQSDRPNMVFPEIFIEDLAADLDADELLRGTADMLYQAFGLPEAPQKGRS